jgi:hypothetical protein
MSHLQNCCTHKTTGSTRIGPALSGSNKVDRCHRTTAPAESDLQSGGRRKARTPSVFESSEIEHSNFDITDDGIDCEHKAFTHIEEQRIQTATIGLTATQSACFDSSRLSKPRAVRHLMKRSGNVSSRGPNSRWRPSFHEIDNHPPLLLIFLALTSSPSRLFSPLSCFAVVDLVDGAAFGGVGVSESAMYCDEYPGSVAVNKKAVGDSKTGRRR